MDKDGRLFSGYEYFLTHNDGDVTLDGIIAEMDGFISRQGIHYTSEEIKEKVEEVENKISHLGMTIDKYRLSGEKKTAVYTEEREALHEKIIKEIVINRATSKMRTEQPRVMIVLGGRPGSGEGMHADGEYVETESVKQIADIQIKFLESLAHGDIKL